MAVPRAMAIKYGCENPFAGICPPKAFQIKTITCATTRNGIHSIAGPTEKRLST